MTHKFKLGQPVNFAPEFPASAQIDFEITKLLPFDGNGFLYRIKSKREAYERVVREDQLSFDS